MGRLDFLKADIIGVVSTLITWWVFYLLTCFFPEVTNPAFDVPSMGWVMLATVTGPVVGFVSRYFAQVYFKE